MDQKKINQYVELLADNLVFLANYARFAGSSKKMLIVEGATDREFLRNLINEDVWCVTAKDAFSNEDYLSMTEKQLSRSIKIVIIDVVYGLAVYPMLINSKGLDEWSIYGMIDMDFDPSSAHTNTNKLFITDTHDLETLMLSTDEKLLTKLDKCTITDEDIQKALYVSYQLGFLRKTINDVCKKEISLRPLEPGKRDIDYGLFVDDCRVSVPDLIKFLNSSRINGLPTPKMEQMINKVLKNKAIKKKTDEEGLWKQGLKDFDKSAIGDFWNVVNGHDILALLRFYNEGAKQAYSNIGGSSLNREFEFDLIDKYDYANFSRTKIYTNMKSETVVKVLP